MHSNMILLGGFAGIIASLVFVVYHYLTISPIWFIIPIASIFGFLTGASLAWSYKFIFDEITVLNSIVLVGIYFLPVIVLEFFTYFFLKKEYTIEETMNPNATGALIAVSFGIVIPFAIIYGLFQGLVMGGSREEIMASISTNLVIFVGIGHNLPIFNKIIIEDSWVLIKAKLLILSIFVILMTTWVISIHILLHFNE